MGYLLSVLFTFSSAWSLDCLNLHGNWGGDCIYSSQKYGDLSGEIEFRFQQSSCQQIVIDGSVVKIPGNFEEQVKTDEGLATTRLALQWANSQKTVLAYNYEFFHQQGASKKDHVLLKGQFHRQGPKLILQQTGSVEADPVKILCELIK